MYNVYLAVTINVRSIFYFLKVMHTQILFDKVLPVFLNGSLHKSMTFRNEKKALALILTPFFLSPSGQSCVT